MNPNFGQSVNNGKKINFENRNGLGKELWQHYERTRDIAQGKLVPMQEPVWSWANQARAQARIRKGKQPRKRRKLVDIAKNRIDQKLGGIRRKMKKEIREEIGRGLILPEEHEEDDHLNKRGALEMSNKMLFQEALTHYHIERDKALGKNVEHPVYSWEQPDWEKPWTFLMTRKERMRKVLDKRMERLREKMYREVELAHSVVPNPCYIEAAPVLTSSSSDSSSSSEMSFCSSQDSAEKKIKIVEISDDENNRVINKTQFNVTYELLSDEEKDKDVKLSSVVLESDEDMDVTIIEVLPDTIELSDDETGETAKSGDEVELIEEDITMVEICDDEETPKVIEEETTDANISPSDDAADKDFLIVDTVGEVDSVESCVSAENETTQQSNAEVVQEQQQTVDDQVCIDVNVITEENNIINLQAAENTDTVIEIKKPAPNFTCDNPIEDQESSQKDDENLQHETNLEDTEIIVDVVGEDVDDEGAVENDITTNNNETTTANTNESQGNNIVLLDTSTISDSEDEDKSVESTHNIIDTINNEEKSQQTNNEEKLQQTNNDEKSQLINNEEKSQTNNEENESSQGNLDINTETNLENKENTLEMNREINKEKEKNDRIELFEEAMQEDFEKTMREVNKEIMQENEEDMLQSIYADIDEIGLSEDDDCLQDIVICNSHASKDLNEEGNASDGSLMIDNISNNIFDGSETDADAEQPHNALDTEDDNEQTIQEPKSPEINVEATNSEASFDPEDDAIINALIAADNNASESFIISDDESLSKCTKMDVNENQSPTKKVRTNSFVNEEDDEDLEIIVDSPTKNEECLLIVDEENEDKKNFLNRESIDLCETDLTASQNGSSSSIEEITPLHLNIEKTFQEDSELVFNPFSALIRSMPQSRCVSSEQTRKRKSATTDDCILIK